MIEIALGNVGSGKTAHQVMNILNSSIHTFSNIDIYNCSNHTKITADMIYTLTYKSGKPVYKVNKQFWIDQVKKYGDINVVIDEAHIVMNSRKSSHPINLVVTDWIAIIRRVLGSSSTTKGKLVLITQLSNRLDIIARDMANKVIYHQCFFTCFCQKCGYEAQFNNLTPEIPNNCFNCGTDLIRTNHILYVEYFKSMEDYIKCKDYKLRTYYKRSIITNIKDVFKYYNTLQWDDLLSKYNQ